MDLRPPSTSFHGREEDLRAIGVALRGARLVTLWGPGGVGKTRLALRFLELRGPRAGAEERAACDLSRAASGAEMVEILAAHLGLEVTAIWSGAELETLCAALAGRERLLLVLDNVEQIKGAPALLERLLASTPELRMLITSRTRLDVPGGRAIEVRPLGQGAAAELFLARVRAISPDWGGEREGRPAIETIVARLDRVPLALELAAGRSSVLAPRQLLARLDDSLELLRDRTGSRPERQASIRAVLRWSWELLDPPGRRAAARLSVFCGAFDLDAAEILLQECAAGVLDQVEALRAAAWLQALPDADPEAGLHFRMFELVRRFAGERLEEAPQELARAEALHARWAVESAERLGGLLGRPGARQAQAALRGLWADLLQAHHRRKQRDPGLAVRAALALGPLLATRGASSRVIDAVDSAVSLAGPGHKGRALRLRGELRLRAGRSADGVRDLGAALELLAEAGATREEGLARIALGRRRAREGAKTQAEDELRLARVLFEAAGDRDGMARAASAQGWLALEGERWDEAHRHLFAALAGAGELGNRELEAQVRNGLGMLFVQGGRLEEAEDQLGRALRLASEAGAEALRAAALNNLAALHMEAGRSDLADRHQQEALDAQRRSGNRRGVAVGLLNLGMIADDRGQWALAEERYLRARESLESLAEQPLVALCTGLVAAVRAAAGELESARSALAEAGVAVPPTTRARVVLQEARRAVATADHGRAGQLLAQLDDLLAEEAGPAAVSAWTRSIRRTVRRGAEDLRRELAGEAAGLVILDGGTSFRLLGAGRVDLGRREVERKLLSELVRAARKDPGEPLALEELLARLWPGEQIERTAGKNRVQVALSGLRRKGLRPWIRRRGEGWFLDPELTILEPTP